MRVGTLTIAIISSVLLCSCTETKFQFGQPYETGVMHDDLGNVHENTQLDPLIPISGNTQPSKTPEDEPTKIAQPRKPRPKVQTSAPENIASDSPRTITNNQALSSNNWQPNEALLIRGTELIHGLQRELGKKPSPNEMQQRLQSHMGLSNTQAQILLSTLGAI